MKQLTYKLPPRCAIETVTIRETNGVDEAAAELEAEAHGTPYKHALVEQSIMRVNGKPVQPGASGYREWPTKTRQVVAKFHAKLNEPDLPALYPLIEKAESEGTNVVDGRTQTRYEFPEGLDLEYVVLREMMEADERAAAAVGKGGSADVSDEMIRLCVVSTDLGEGMSTEVLRGLRTKTRTVLTTYWSGMNFVDEEELRPLEMEAEQTATEIGADADFSDDSGTPSSESGSGSPAQAGVA